MKDYENNLNYITTVFSEWHTKIYLNNHMGLFNLSTLSENIIRDLFNIIFEKENYYLENANLFIHNVESIDLKDKDNKIAIQVTTNNSYDKIKHTVNLFVDKKHYLTYGKLLIVILDKKKEGRVDYKYNEYNFEIKNVLYIDDITNLIRNLPLNKISLIRCYLEQEYEKIKLDKKATELKEELRNNKYINEPIIERKLSLVNDKNNPYLLDMNQFSINDITLSNKKIVILGDASCGKTFFLKNLVDKINDTDYYFAIYKTLNTYSNQDLETYLFKKYNFIERRRIILVLDGFDEIEKKFRLDFIKKLKDLINENKDMAIIISCRSNIYVELKKLNDFENYTLCDFNENDVNAYFQMHKLNFEDICNNFKYREYGFLLHNPFYLNIICKHYKMNGKLPNRGTILDCAIDDIFEEDKKKYLLTIDDDIDNIQIKQKKFIQQLGFIFECLGKNYISDEELRQLANNEYKYIVYSGLLRKEENNWSFIHNNFGEYLASKELEKYNFKEIKKIILQDRKHIKYSWYNTLGFYLSNTHDEELIQLIIDDNYKLISNIEKNRVSNNQKLFLFKKIIDPYLNKKIWIPWDILRDNKFAEFFATEDIYNYLYNIILENKNYVNTSNSLQILINLVYYINDENLQDLLTNILLLNKYNKQHKRYALYILANARIGDKNFISDIINKLKNEENQHLRAGYFYYINHMNLVDELIEDIIDYKSIVGRMIKAKLICEENDEEEPTLVDEYIQYVELFKNIHNKKSIELINEKLKTSEEKREKFGEDLLKNICISIKYLDISDEEKNELMIELYLTFLKQFKSEEIVYLRNLLLSKGLNLKLFKILIENYNIKYKFELTYIINEECIKYFYEEYEKGNYNDKVAEDLLYDIPTSSPYFDFIINKYESNTNKKWQEPYRPLSKIEKQKVSQKYFDSLFDKEDYIKNINYVFEISELSSINLNEIYHIEINDNKHLWDDMIFQHTSNFLYRSIDETNMILDKNNVKEFLDKFDWDFVILNETLNFLKSENDINVSKEQINIIEQKCLSKLNYINYNDSFEQKEKRIYVKNNIYVILSDLRYKLKLHYPTNILLDMLMFEPFLDFENKKLQAIVDEVGFEKCKERIIFNLKTFDLLDFILESYLNFFMKYELFNETNVIYNYFCSSKTSSFTKICCLKYIVKSNDKKTLKNILNNINNLDLDNDTILQMLRYFDDENVVVLRYLRPLYKKTKDEEIKKMICKMEIKKNISRGYKKYYKYLKINNKTYGMDFNSYISNVNKLRLIIICFKMLKLTYLKDFKDSKFDSLRSNLTKAITNIGKKNEFNRLFVIILTKLFILKNIKLENINFLNYIIEDLKYKSINVQDNNMTLENIKKILK